MSDASNDNIINGLRPDNQASAGGQPLVFRPAIRSMWFLFFGFFLGPGILFFERDPGGSAIKWIILTFLCLGVVIHRLSLKYTLGADFLKKSSWWGLKPDEALTLAYISEVKIMEGFVSRLAGCGLIEIRSRAPDEGAMIMLGQAEARKVAGAIEAAVNMAHRPAE